jgi:hypothetical protein
MLKDIADHAEPQKFKDLPSAVYFIVPGLSNQTLYQKMIPFDMYSSVCNALKLEEFECNHGHSHTYDLRAVNVTDETTVIRVEVLKIDILFRKI